MSKHSNPNSESSSLKAQLEESRHLREQLEKTYRTDINNLTQFIARLGNTLRGIDGDLDHKLSKMSSAMTRVDKIDAVIPVMDDVSLVLQQHGSRVQRELQTTQSRMLAAARRLQKLSNLPKPIREEIRDLITQVEGPAFSVLHYLPYLTQLVELYQKSMDIRVSNGNSQGMLEQLKQDGDNKYAELREELVNLISLIDLNGTAATGLQNIRQQLISGLSEDQFVLSCVQVVRLIVQGINEERQNAQVFLESLNEVLGNVSNSVARSIKATDKAEQAHKTLDKKLDEGIKALSESAANACNLSELTQQVGVHVETLVTTLGQKQALQSRSHQLLKSELEAAQSKIMELEDEAEGYKQKLSEQKFKSLQDSLTKLPNRAAFEERLELEFKRWQRYGTPLAIAVADIDHFKRINDSYGHIAGDKTLQVIANMLKKSLRGTDFVARFGGEEFVIIFPQTELTGLLEPLEKARKRIQSIPFKFKNNDISITISVGAAEFKDQDTMSTVFERADKALYEAKQQGRNRVVIDSR
ncbi:MULTISPECIES: GGDEF domain-containing protein [Gammaproteobacteria]|uniref:GGDEF domain-containing protein n=1 Tax=Gammaproteobacteria TaxID=1236 RepID=UPI000DCF98A4|nr:MULTISPECIES: GGDEF domain-containing protein [Gammaproteobacteria]RTE86981.1 GGDEF domain-containing protein [Aliidiomarina sp. B3213]TCZ93229.1 GGDEF domain-containing protein [Lysobacter sp. N42]